MFNERGRKNCDKQKHRQLSVQKICFSPFVVVVVRVSIFIEAQKRWNFAMDADAFF